MRRVAGAFAALPLVLGAAWGIGFSAFNSDARHAVEPPAAADAIVVLTGGADRIDTALQLLLDRRAPLLLVSGVSGGADLTSLSRRVPLDAELARRVTLGRNATSTTGNAAETGEWARAHAVRSLIVVTAGYHMPRALLELQRTLPDVALHPVPVQSPALRGAPPATTVRMLATEYDKLLAVRLGLTRGVGEGWMVELRMGDGS